MRMSAAGRAGWRGIVAAAMAAVAGCGALQAPPGGDAVHYEYRRPDGRAFVRIEPIERDAPPNDQPAALRPAQVRVALASVREKNAQTFGVDDPVLDARELDEIAPPLTAALAAATPAQDVTFFVMGSHGLFGEHSAQTATTGRAFVRGGKLNVILGLVRSSYDAIDISGTAQQVATGHRKARVEYEWTLTAPGAQLVDRRGDWLAFDVASLSAAAAAAATPAPAALPAAADRPRIAPAAAAPAAPVPASPATDESRYQDMASRLRLLDRLRADGLVSEDEYRERRRAILQAL